MTSVRNRSVELATALALLLCLAPASSRADDTHYQSYLVGERAVGLGGAFTAIADDSSGAYYNPAGLAQAPYSSISLSAALYGFVANKNTLGVPDAVESSDTSFIAYPTTAAWIQILRKGDKKSGVGRVQAALSLITPQSSLRRERLAYQLDLGNLPGSTDGLRSDNLDIQSSEDDTVWVGLSAAWKPTRWLSVGATVYTTVRSGVYQFYNVRLLRSFAADGSETDRVAVPSRTDIKLRHVGLIGVFGAIVRLGERLRLGLSVRTPNIELHGKANAKAFAVTSRTAGGLAVRALEVDADFSDRQPLKVALGAAYLVERRWGVSADFSIYAPVGQYQVLSGSGDADLDRGFPLRKRFVWQVNVGAELYPVSSLALRAGFFTNRSALGTCEGANVDRSCNALFADGVDQLGVSGGVSYELRRATLSLGWSVSFGSDNDSTVIGGERLSLERSRAFIFLMLGGSFRF